MLIEIDIKFHRKSVPFSKIVGLYYRIMMLLQGSVSKVVAVIQTFGDRINFHPHNVQQELLVAAEERGWLEIGENC